MSGPEGSSAAPLSAIRWYFEISLYLLLLTSVLTLVATGKLDLVSGMASSAALLVKGYRWSRGCRPELSHRAATWLVASYFVFFPIDLWGFSRALAAGAPSPALYAALLAAIHLTLFAMVVRLYSASTTRDYLFLTMLAFTNVLAAAILTVDTLFLVAFLIFLALAVSTFVGLEMRRSAEGACVAPLEPGTPPARRLNRALGLTSASTAVSALLTGAVIFFLIPRFSVGYLGGYTLHPSLISGFSDNVELGQIGAIKKNPAVVMRVRAEDGAQRIRGMRWRGIALTDFDGRRWFTPPHKRSVITLSADGWFLLPQAPQQLRQNSIPFRYTVLLEPLATDTLFVAAQADRVRGRFAARGTYLVVDRTDSLTNPYHNFTKLRYEGFSYLPAVPPEWLRRASADYPGTIRQFYLQLPDLDPRIPALARQVTAQAPTAYDKAAAIEHYLRTRFGYTLDLSATSKADPLAHFLFERRAGHCEYFAAAMTVMLRSLGIPARYVNGFLPGEYNELGGDFIVRASDAHSWVEAYFPGFNWISFDPTPPADEKAEGVFGFLALYWDWFELVWSEWVINYDFSHQVTLAQNLQRVSRDWAERARNFLIGAHRKGIDKLKEWQTRVIAAPHALPGFVAIVGAVILLFVLLFRGRAILAALAALWGLHVASHSVLTPRLATLLYQQMLRLLARRGISKQPGQTPLEFASSVTAAELAAPVAQLTDLYQMARFGDHSAEAQKMGDLLASIKAIMRSPARST